MRKLIVSLTATALMLAVGLAARTVSQEQVRESTVARGVVFHDTNGNGLRDDGDKPLPGVRVSNGEQIVKTDASGNYELPVTEDTILFVIKPTGWRTPVDELQLPRFYYIHKPHGSRDLKYAGVAPTGPLPDSVDFPLYPQEEPEEFKAVLFGDPQPRDQKEVDYIAHDVIEELVGTDASFGVTLGDIVFDDLTMFEAQARSVALLGIPWYNVIGNHDINYDARSDRESDETFERNFGPSYYSFDYGAVHFIVLDDIDWYIPNDAEKGRYRAGLGGAQIDFVKRDLELIPNEQLVVLMMHIPLVDVGDRQELYRLIEQRPACISISGHTHHHEHRMITREDGWMGPEPHHHIINVTVSGSWWSGAGDDRGIPHTMCADGTPNGYTIMTFNGTEYSLAYHAAGRSRDYQMNVFAPEQVAASALASTQVFANVFNGSEAAVVEMRIGTGEWRRMNYTRAVDPTFAAVHAAESLLKGNKDKPFRDLPNPKPSTHLWELALPADLTAGSHLIQVRSTDMFGLASTGNRIVRVVAE